MDVLSYIETAITKKEPIKIKYHGGSQPGAIREITPTKIVDGKIYAVCMHTGVNKSFLLNKIDLVESQIITEYNTNLTLPTPTYSESDGFSPIVSQYQAIWQEYGWHVDYDEYGIYLYRKWKNGRPLKYAHVSLEFRPEIYDYTDFGENGEEINYSRINSKPWLADGIAYKFFDKAIARFIERSRTESPIAGNK